MDALVILGSQSCDMTMFLKLNILRIFLISCIKFFGIAGSQIEWYRLDGPCCKT